MIQHWAYLVSGTIGVGLVLAYLRRAISSKEKRWLNLLLAVSMAVLSAYLVAIGLRLTPYSSFRFVLLLVMTVIVVPWSTASSILRPKANRQDSEIP